MPLMMVLIFWCLLVKVLSVVMIPTAISSGWFWSTLFVSQCMIKSDVVCCKEISRALHKTFSTLRASLKQFLQIFLYLLKLVAIKSPIIMIGVAEFFKRFFWNVYVSYHPGLCMRDTSDLQLLGWLFLVKLRASLFMVSGFCLCFINFLGNKITFWSPLFESWY